MNVTKAILHGRTICKTTPLYQFDYGQILQILGPNLPDAYEVHFSNTPTGDAKTMIGDASGVVIPDEYLQSGEPVYAWVYLHQGADDGETEYHITIPVIRRARIVNQPPTPVQQDAISQAIALLNYAVDKTGQDVIEADEIKDDVEQIKSDMADVLANFQAALNEGALYINGGNADEAYARMQGRSSQETVIDVLSNDEHYWNTHVNVGVENEQLSVDWT